MGRAESELTLNLANNLNAILNTHGLPRLYLAEATAPSAREVLDAEVDPTLEVVEVIAFGLDFAPCVLIDIDKQRHG